MERPQFEVADVFRRYGSAYRQQHATSLSRGQRRVMSAIERCRNAALGGHLSSVTPAVTNVPPTIAAATAIVQSASPWRAPSGSKTAKPNSFRPHTSTWSSPCRKRLPPSPIRIRKWFTVFSSARSPRPYARLPLILNIWAPDRLPCHPAQLGTKLAFPSASPLRRAGGGISVDGKRWIACRPGFFLPVRVLAGLFRRLFLEDLQTAFDQGKLQFFSSWSDSGTGKLSFSIWRHFTEPSGWYTANGPSGVPNKSSTTWAAIPTAWPSPITDCLTSTTAR